jgi:hypothetical protein
MTRTGLLSAAVGLGGLAMLAAPSLAAAPPGTAPTPQSEAWRLISLPDAKVPAAWVINTANGDTYLCGAGARDGRVHLTCIQADFLRSPAHPG